MRITRRSATATVLGSFTALTTLLAAPITAQSKDKASRQCLTVLYPFAPDAHFDFDYYRNKHLAMMSKLYGKSVGRMQVRKGLHKGDGSPPAFLATLTVEILSMDGFNAAGKEHLPKLMADLTNFSNITPVGQIEEIVE